MALILTKLQELYKRPFLLLGVLWPTVLLVPHLPGIPRPAVNALPWRQELLLTSLLTITLSFLLTQRSNVIYRLHRGTKSSLALGVLFVSWIWLSSFWAIDFYSSIHLALQWTSYLVFFALMVLLPPRVIRYSVITFAVVVFVLGVASAIEFWFGAPLNDGSFRVATKPILRGSGTFGETMGAATILFASFSLLVKKRRAALLLGATSLIGWMATLQSLERAAFIATSLGLLLLFCLSLGARSRFLRLTLISSAFVIALGLQLLPARESYPDDATSTLERFQRNEISTSSNNVRLLLWGVGLEIFKAHPFVGVGGNNYQAAYAEGRATFSRHHPDSSLIALNEDLLPIYAHNEYVQILAELGLIGISFFVAFGCSLVANLLRAIKTARLRWSVTGPGLAMMAFVISSGASASSFRYLSGGLIFFFAAALVARTLNSESLAESQEAPVRKPTWVLVSVLSIIIALSIPVFGFQAAGVVLHGLAEASADEAAAEQNYRTSLALYPYNVATQFSYGMWLYGRHRSTEALPYLRNAVNKGLNTSICFEYLAAAEDVAGNQTGAEQTLARATEVYPRSVFLLVRHSVALQRLSRYLEAEKEFSRAVAIDGPAARGWQYLIVSDIDAADAAAKRESDITLPRDLMPAAAIFAVLQENEMRNPELANQGWRKRVRTAEFRSTQR